MTEGLQRCGSEKARHMQPARKETRTAPGSDIVRYRRASERRCSEEEKILATPGSYSCRGNVQCYDCVAGLWKTSTVSLTPFFF